MRKRQLWVGLLAAAAACGALAPAARAQVFVGPGVTRYGYFGYYPGAYSSSWSNGFSLYGPPVPTSQRIRPLAADTP